MAQALFLLGSPRKNGNSETLAKIVGDHLHNSGVAVEYIRLNKLSIKPCQGCDGCHKDGQCVIKDDMTDLYEKIDLADHLFLVSPVYFYSVSAQLKLAVDRCQARWSRKYILGQRLNKERRRTGHLISTGATKGARLFEGLLLCSRCLFDALDLIEGDHLLVRGAEEKSWCRNHQDPLDEARIFGTQLLGKAP